jgi:hypothetical protein
VLLIVKSLFERERELWTAVNMCFFAVLNFLTGGHSICTIYREVSDILFQHQELRYHEGQTQSSEVHWGNSDWWTLN